MENDNNLTVMIADSLIFQLFTKGYITFEEMKFLQDKNKEIFQKKS